MKVDQISTQMFKIANLPQDKRKSPLQSLIKEIDSSNFSEEELPKPRLKLIKEILTELLSKVPKQKPLTKKQKLQQRIDELVELGAFYDQDEGIVVKHFTTIKTDKLDGISETDWRKTLDKFSESKPPSLLTALRLDALLDLGATVYHPTDNPKDDIFKIGDAEILKSDIYNPSKDEGLWQEIYKEFKISAEAEAKADAKSKAEAEAKADAKSKPDPNLGKLSASDLDLDVDNLMSDIVDLDLDVDNLMSELDNI